MTLGIRSRIESGDVAAAFSRVRDDSSCGLLLFDQECRLVSATPNTSRLLGIEIQPLIGSPVTILPASIQRLLKSTSDSGQHSTETELIKFSDQHPRSLRFTALPLHDTTAPVTLAVLIQDLTDAHRLEDDILQLDRLASVGTLAAEMAHEVRNALVAVKTFVDLLLEKNPGSELEETVQREMKRIDSIVGQVLRYSRPSARDFKPISVHAMLERALMMVRSRFEGRNVTIVSRLAASPDTVHGDENHLEQALLNILLNAADAMSGDGTLTLETDRVRGAGREPMHTHAHLVELVIRDTGAGISAEDMAQLFDPFFTTKKNGTGLGLAITKRIVHEHGGVISAESQHGKGSAFKILLPAV